MTIPFVGMTVIFLGVVVLVDTIDSVVVTKVVSPK